MIKGILSGRKTYSAFDFYAIMALLSAVTQLLLPLKFSFLVLDFQELYWDRAIIMVIGLVLAWIGFRQSMKIELYYTHNDGCTSWKYHFAYRRKRGDLLDIIIPIGRSKYDRVSLQ